MPPRYMSTGQAAQLCSVTPDTILKWVRSGLLPARRTPGGHHRIDRRDVERIMRSALAERPGLAEPRGDAPQFRYCWEYKGGTELLPGCLECVVYELRAQRCYELRKLAPELGRRTLFCELSCEECDYFRHVSGQGTNVLVVTDDALLGQRLARDAGRVGLNVQVTDCEYACSSLVQSFRPDFAVVDCTMGAQVSGDIAVHLHEDPRIPFVRIILAGTEDDYPGECDKTVFARIAKPFDIDDVVACARRAGAASKEGETT